MPCAPGSSVQAALVLRLVTRQSRQRARDARCAGALEQRRHEGRGHARMFPDACVRPRCDTRWRPCRRSCETTTATTATATVTLGPPQLLGARSTRARRGTLGATAGRKLPMAPPPAPSLIPGARSAWEGVRARMLNRHAAPRVRRATLRTSQHRGRTPLQVWRYESLQALGARRAACAVRLRLHGSAFAVTTFCAAVAHFLNLCTLPRYTLFSLRDSQRRQRRAVTPLGTASTAGELETFDLHTPAHELLAVVPAGKTRPADVGVMTGAMCVRAMAADDLTSAE